MTWIVIGALALIALIYLGRRGGSRVTLAEVEEAIADGGQLIDVRTAEEYRLVHAKGAKNVPLQSLQSGASVGGSKAKPIYVYCHSGARAASARAILQQAGYEQVVSLGGLGAWKRLGGSVV